MFYNEDSRSTRPERVFADQKDDAIVVEYIVETFDTASQQSLSERKRIKIFPKAIDDYGVDISKLARKTIKKCKHIPHSWLSRVEDVLVEIQQRQECGKERKDGHELYESNTIEKHVDETLECALDLLYGDEDEKIKGSLQVLSLCEDVENLKAIAEHHQMVSALTRVVSDKGSFSADTAFNICSIFLSMAAVSDFHPILAKYKVGSMIMDVASEVVSSRIEESLNSRNKACSNEKCSAMLFVCFSILNRLSDDSDVLRKMLKKGIIVLVSDCVSLDLPERTLESTLFKLHRISVYGETATYCSQDQCLIIESLVSTLHRGSNDITQRAFSVLYNFSFNKGCRRKMVSSGLAKIISRVIHSTTQGGMALKILYQLSTDRYERRELLVPEIERSLIKACKGSCKNVQTDEIVYAILINVSLQDSNLLFHVYSINISGCLIMININVLDS